MDWLREKVTIEEITETEAETEANVFSAQTEAETAVQTEAETAAQTESES